MRAQYQGDISFAFAVGVTNEAGAAVMAAFLMRRLMGINHQYVEPCLPRIIACGSADRAATDNDKIVLHGEFQVIALLAG